jgi:hypothetical protein
MQRNVLPNAARHIGVFGHPGTGGFICRVARDGDGPDHAASGLIQNGATNRQRAIGGHGLHARDAQPLYLRNKVALTTRERLAKVAA